jgi:hypothetical protein
MTACETFSRSLVACSESVGRTGTMSRSSSVETWMGSSISMEATTMRTRFSWTRQILPGYPLKRISDCCQEILGVQNCLVGCGSGLGDPNFSTLLKWASERHENVPNRHCLLIRDGDGLNHQMLVRLEYSLEYQNLARYLCKLLDDPSQPALIGHNFSSTSSTSALCRCAVQ